MKGNVGVSFGFDVSEVWLCDLLEHPQRRLSLSENRVTLPISNFEIGTLRVKKT